MALKKETLVKMFSIIAGLLLSATAFAGVSEMSWPEIQSSHSYFVDAPGAFFVNSNPRALGTVYKRFLTVDGRANVCVARNMIYGGKLQSCVKTERKDGDNEVCVKYEANQLWAPISGTRQLCVRYAGSDSSTCAEYKIINYRINTTVAAKLYNKSGINGDGDNMDSAFVGVKAMKLPGCSK